MGWCFALRFIPELGLTTLEAWKDKLKDSRIKDEYGRLVSLEELLSVITDRKGRPPEQGSNATRSLDMVPGPNNLLRHRVDGAHCVGHGEGTWDYIQGEFL